MDRLRQASQVAFICNMVFLFCVLLRYVTFVRDPVIISVTLILGWIMAFWINAAVNLWAVAVLLGGRLKASLPRWLFFTNLGIGFVQLYYYFF